MYPCSHLLSICSVFICYMCMFDMPAFPCSIKLTWEMYSCAYMTCDIVPVHTYMCKQKPCKLYQIFQIVHVHAWVVGDIIMFLTFTIFTEFVGSTVFLFCNTAVHNFGVSAHDLPAQLCTVMCVSNPSVILLILRIHEFCSFANITYAHACTL